MKNEVIRKQILGVLKNQIKMNEPKCVNLTIERLVEEGYSENDAREMVAAILLEEMYLMLKENYKFDEEKYEKKLSGLGRK